MAIKTIVRQAGVDDNPNIISAVANLRSNSAKSIGNKIWGVLFLIVTIAAFFGAITVLELIFFHPFDGINTLGIMFGGVLMVSIMIYMGIAAYKNFSAKSNWFLILYPDKILCIFRKKPNEKFQEKELHLEQVKACLLQRKKKIELIRTRSSIRRATMFLSVTLLAACGDDEEEATGDGATDNDDDTTEAEEAEESDGTDEDIEATEEEEESENDTENGSSRDFDEEDDNGSWRDFAEEEDESGNNGGNSFEPFEYEGAWPDVGVEVESSESDLEDDLVVFFEAQIDEEFPQHSSEYTSYLRSVVNAVEQNVTVDVHYDRFMDVVPERIRNMERAEFTTDEVEFIRAAYLEGMQVHHDVVEILDGQFDDIHEEQHDPELEEAFYDGIVEGNHLLATAYIQMVQIAEETDVIDIDELTEMEEFIENNYFEELEEELEDDIDEMVV
ncbi:hypothetical protein HUG20_15755 [Salicibibacter cibi]|uniref:Uncharacterized protein n=1 Tax=Salicibibacter cibi TaxID=2743001 RepID=A0A7T7CGJ6_9BACI|nr:DUF308 domain-containing protein [Salicibibacter cibi]QQK81214.1 hypothetical protein HUG20_15755 [Salicibibacter cibi]